MTTVVDLTERRQPRHRAWLAVAGWTAIAAAVALILNVANGIPLLAAVLACLIWYYVLGGLVWLVCAVDVRHEVWTRTRSQILALHTLGGIVALGLWMAIVVVFARVAIGPGHWNVVFGRWWMFQVLSTATVYAAGVGIGLVVQSLDRERERERREAQLEVLAREAELTAIKAQLQPHFLFNALNSILALIEHDPVEARQMLTRLSSLLHGVFDRLDEQAVPLERELDTIRDYLEIERIRFGDRLTFSIDAEPGVRRAWIPPFLLQPIVENAVKHGIEPYSHSGAVRITGHLRNGRLQLHVGDTGLAGHASDPPGHRRGLTLTRQRLEAVYGPGEATLQCARGAEGFIVTLDLPAQTDVI